MRRGQHGRQTLAVGRRTGRRLEQTVQFPAHDLLIDHRVIAGPFGEHPTDGLLLLVITIQVEQWPGVVRALRFDQSQRPQRPRRSAAHQRADPHRGHHRGDIRPRQRRRIDSGVPGFVGVDADLPHPVQLEAHRPGPHRAHGQRRDEQHLLGRLPAQPAQPERDMHVGGRQHARLVEHAQQTGPPLRQLNRGHRPSSPASNADSATIKSTGGFQSKTPQPAGVRGPIMPRTNRYRAPPRWRAGS